MSEAVYEALRAIQSDLSQVEVLAQGIANANTATPFSRSVAASLRDWRCRAHQRVALVTVNERSGSLTATGRALDMAITGNGYLQVESDRDDVALLVRGGSLHLGSDGTLTTATGRSVLVDGAPVQIDGGDVVVNATCCSGVAIGRLSIVELLQPDAMFVAGEGIYGVPNEMLDVAPENVSVLQGYVEQSNVNSSESIICMMELSKHVESVQRSLVALDNCWTRVSTISVGVRDKGVEQTFVNPGQVRPGRKETAKEN